MSYVAYCQKDGPVDGMTYSTSTTSEWRTFPVSRHNVTNAITVLLYYRYVGYKVLRVASSLGYSTDFAVLLNFSHDSTQIQPKDKENGTHVQSSQNT